MRLHVEKEGETIRECRKVARLSCEMQRERGENFSMQRKVVEEEVQV